MNSYCNQILNKGHIHILLLRQPFKDFHFQIKIQTQGFHQKDLWLDNKDSNAYSSSSCNKIKFSQETSDFKFLNKFQVLSQIHVFKLTLNRLDWCMDCHLYCYSREKVLLHRRRSSPSNQEWRACFPVRFWTLLLFAKRLVNRSIQTHHDFLWILVCKVRKDSRHQSLGVIKDQALHQLQEVDRIEVH